MITKRSLLIVAIMPVLVFSVSGCRKAEPTHIMPDGMVMRDKDMKTAKEGHGAMKMDHGSGKMTDAKSVALPDNFPSDVPIYPGARVAISSSTAEGASIGLETNEDRQKGFRYYEKNLAAQGWKIDQASTAKTTSILQGKKANRSCDIVISDRSKFAKTSISVMITKQKG